MWNLRPFWRHANTSGFAKATGLRRRRVTRLSCAAVVLGASGGPAFGAHPLQTEDTGTQGRGNVEIENAFSSARAADTRLFVYQPQLSYGASPSVDLILQPSWLSSRTPDTGTVRGFGDTNLDAKWRFYGVAPWSTGVRLGVTGATSQHGLGEPHGTLGSHALMIVTLDVSPLVIHANAGVSHQPGGPGDRSRIAQLSTAAMWSVNERLTLTADAGAQSSRDRQTSAWSGYELAGAIYTLRPGLDADVGYLRSIRATTPTRVWLVGLTYRFAL